MFKIFPDKKKLHLITLCEKLAFDARIDVVVEHGLYSGFLIFLDFDSKTLADNFNDPEALSKFVGVIEERIENRQYNDPSDGIDIVSEIRKSTNWKPELNVVRAVIARGNQPFFRWNP